MTILHRRIAAVALPALLATQSAVAGMGPAADAPDDGARVCQQLRATGATDIEKAVLTLTAKLPGVPARDTAAFERENAAAMPDAIATVRSPLYNVWLAGRYLDRATR